MIRFAIPVFLALSAVCAAPASAAVALLLEEPHGTFGMFNPTGHAAVYLTGVCAASHTSVRRCQPGEKGVVLSRYRWAGGTDWIAVPLVPYLYAVDRTEDIPAQPDELAVDAVRERYRRRHLMDLAPEPGPDRKGRRDWTQWIGVAYDRTIYGFQLETSPEQDDRLIADLNARSQRNRFNILIRNCADFARGIVNFYYPHTIRRNLIADAGITTPKQAAKCIVKYARKNRDVEFSAFYVPQVAGSVERSTRVRGVLESLVRSKKYVVLLAVFHPYVAATAAVGYLASGRFNPSREIVNPPPKPEERPQPPPLASAVYEHGGR